jgi:hypothetical protein
VQFALDLLEKSDGLIVLFDDDDPPVKNDSLEVLVDLFGTMSSSDPATGGVGLVGGQLRGRFPVRLHNLAPYSDLEGIIKVDWINGGYLPIYSRSIFDAGARFNERLFFGYEELDFGLTARRLGFSLYSSGDIWQQHSELYGKAAARARRRAAADRLDFSVLDAYKTRNLVWTLKVNGFRLSAYYYSIRRLVSKVVMRQPSQSYRAVRWTWLALRAGLRGDRLAPQDLDLGR